jgi:hypothetical protein
MLEQRRQSSTPSYTNGKDVNTRQQRNQNILKRVRVEKKENGLMIRGPSKGLTIPWDLRRSIQEEAEKKKKREQTITQLREKISKNMFFLTIMHALQFASH